MRRRSAPWALVLALVTSGAAARAEDAPSPASKDKPVEVVVTGTRTPESTQRATVRTDVVTREEAERRGATNVAEALQGQLGVEVNPSAYGSLGNPSAIQIQGFDADRVLILEDGERVIGDVGGVIDLSQLPLTDVSRIEVVAGPTSSLYGTSAIGGVVNILTAPPAREGLSGRARLEGRSRRGVVFQGNGAYRRGDTWVGIDGSFQRQDGVAGPTGTLKLAVPDFMSGLLGVRAGARVSEHVTVQARARWIRDASNGREEQVIPGLGTYRVDLPEKTDRFTLRLSETIDLGRGSSVRFTAGRQWALDTSIRDRYESPLDETRERRDVLSSFESTATLADGKRTWVLGARAEAEQLGQELTTIDLVQGAPVAHTGTELPTQTLGSGAIYAQLAYKLHETLTIMPGARAELHVRYGGVVAPRLAIAYRPTPQWIIRASGGRGFRAPSAKEFGFAFDHSIYGYRVIGNANLIPEKSWGVNGDITWRPGSGITLRTGAFGNWITDLIDLDLVKPGDPNYKPDSNVTTYGYQNVGAARTFGVQFNATCEPSPRFRAEVGYAYLWTRNDTDEQPLMGRPPHTIFASVRFALPWRLELVGRARGVTDAFIDKVVDKDPRVPPKVLRSLPFATLDARLARPLWPRALGYIGVLNALDIRKDENLTGDQFLVDQRPIAGRTLYVGLTAELPWEVDP